MVNIIEHCGIDMFDRLARQLELQTLGKGNESLKITREEFEAFYKEFLFELIKGEKRLGDAFCEKYNETNYVLSIVNNESAKLHIERFYVR